MPQPDRVWLIDILSAAQLIQQFVAGVNREDFARDAMRESAVIRQLEIVGEAAKQVSPEFREANSEIPWRKMAGMRDVLIHAYRSVNPDEVWNAATVSIPNLVAVVEPLMPQIEEELREDLTS